MLAVIMAGGHGTRLWPLSTKEKPKQFQTLIGERTMLQATYDRLSHLDSKHIFVSTNTQFADLVKEQLPELPAENIIIEPLRRDTGPAMAFVSHYLAAKGFGDSILSIVYADHYIKDVEQFQNKLQFAQEWSASQKNINIIQVKAKEPNTQLGYVKIGKQIKEVGPHRVYELERFIEKPDYKTAQAYADSLDYLWNTGLYTWHIRSFLELISKHSPEISNPLEKITDHLNCQDIYAQFPKISIDYALMEKLSGNQVHIIPADFNWSDVGNWQTIHNQLKDQTGNVTQGPVTTIDTNDCIVYSDNEHTVTAIGVKDLAIVINGSKILVCPKDETKRIKEHVENQKR